MVSLVDTPTKVKTSLVEVPVVIVVGYFRIFCEDQVGGHSS